MTDSSDDDLIITIEGKKYILPKEVKEREHTHRKKKGWISMWFYKNRKKTRVYKKDVKDDLIITSKLEYQKGIFYKMSQLSAEDDCFDYYYKLKDDVPKNIVRKNARYKNPFAKNRNNWKNVKFENNYEQAEDGKFIVRFN